ncbi:prolyl oligopeptidase family serine peptidase [Flavobacterium granuli]|uniref:Dipeptidyl aminopeptidase/acylaminoacyl peptidase n=1 Tax=Flavobacterium granuli TaxID=280093 RepID=A0ABU1S3K1_9FLAO|nr:prolyl oligopeptidase family serine peptidase [Flavobacterium granuli]MDR6845603.1 dipeptidyl aminopeptidase/acylaminoacyl peptidase [Flavobacterium granuli]
MDFEGSSLVLAFLLLLLSCPCIGQAQQKKRLTENYYGRWGTLEVKAISDHGKWASYAMRYENHIDTLFVQSTDKNKRYVFPNGSDSHFGGEQIFAFLAQESKLKVLQLRKGKIAVFENVKRYELANKGQYIITLNKGYGEKSLMNIRDSDGKVIDSIGGVCEYILNSNKDALVYASSQSGHHQLGIIHFTPYSRVVVSTADNGSFFNLMWDKDTKSVAFLQETNSVHKAIFVKYYRIADKKLFSLDYAAKADSKNMEVFKSTRFAISDDGTKVFFMLAKKKAPNATENLNVTEIWNGTDKWLYTDRQRQQVEGDIPKVALWYPDTGLYLQISDDELPAIMLSGQQQCAVLYNKFSYGLQSKYYEEADFYLTNLKDGSKELILKKQSVDPNQMGFDPFSNKILYYRQSNWWMYDPVAKTYINLTKKVTTRWDNYSLTDAPHQFEAYGNPGWSSDGRNVLLYDANDIWQVAIDGSSCIRLTKGREKNMVYRIALAEYNRRSQTNYDGRESVFFDLSKDLLLEARNTQDWSTGYFIYNSQSGEKPLVYGASKIDEIRKSKNSDYIFQNQTFNQPPQIEFRKKDDLVAKILFQSNKQQNEYFVGKSKLLYYNSKGQKLKAALFYPADYDPTKKYPMVVHIYDVMSDELFQYVNPSFLNRDGFNITNYTLNGYFVLMPDIIYRMSNPGSSAVDCVTAGVNAVVGKGLVDKNKIGLYGHSFGGYESNFIISQTNIFAAAVSGAGVSDFISMYFNISKNGYFQSDMWRFENQQYRIGKSLYEDKETYISNSPIMHVENVRTPLLLWTGKNDRVVPWNQSISYYLALRKLEVTTEMLVYPNEDHSLENPDNQKDLSKRMMAWFDHLLKGDPEPKWISKEIPVD